ncbi:DUF6998 domain-containing protein [Enterococcus thailandicus]|uniref:DUF6998 domain-containing protein n=1 Tax=Enterococcus thailandicus TaxID=417368 RepID=UPI002554AA4A|nr:hypothetical protein [Enterococcus thailandicus]
MNQEEICETFEDYKAVLKKELSWGVHLPELRHLNGRLGELYVAKVTEGQMATEVNQHGYDVISKNGERISVKTTATTSAKHLFFFNKNTLKHVDRVVLLRITNEAELIILLDVSKEQAVKLMKIRGKKMVIRQSKLNNLDYYFQKEANQLAKPYDKDLLEDMNQYNFSILEKNYSLFLKKGVIRLLEDGKLIESGSIKSKLIEIVSSLELEVYRPDGNKFTNKQYARKIINELKLEIL